jgi:hypothetical protein
MTDDTLPLPEPVGTVPALGLENLAKGLGPIGVWPIVQVWATPPDARRLYTDDQMRAYGAACADAAIERCAQRDAQAAEIERQREVIAKVNARCDHLGMRLGEVT